MGRLDPIFVRLVIGGNVLPSVYSGCLSNDISVGVSSFIRKLGRKLPYNCSLWMERFESTRANNYCQSEGVRE